MRRFKIGMDFPTESVDPEPAPEGDARLAPQAPVLPRDAYEVTTYKVPKIFSPLIRQIRATGESQSAFAYFVTWLMFMAYVTAAILIVYGVIRGVAYIGDLGFRLGDKL